MSRPLIQIDIVLPACWKELVEHSFPEEPQHNLDGYKSGKHRLKLDDPEPYYDDVRSISGSTFAGDIYTIELLSGQGNYYGSFVLSGRKNYPDVEVICEDFDGSFDVTYCHQDYDVHLHFVDDYYEHRVKNVEISVQDGKYIETDISLTWLHKPVEIVRRNATQEELLSYALDDAVQDMVMNVHSIWCHWGGNDVGDMELQSLNNVLTAFFGDKR